MTLSGKSLTGDRSVGSSGQPTCPSLPTEKTELQPGDLTFVPKGAVHATFVAPDAAEEARLLVVLGPSHGPDGYEAVDVSTEAPWNTLRHDPGDER